MQEGGLREKVLNIVKMVNRVRLPFSRLSEALRKMSGQAEGQAKGAEVGEGIDVLIMNTIFQQVSTF